MNFINVRELTKRYFKVYKDVLTAIFSKCRIKYIFLSFPCRTIFTPLLFKLLMRKDIRSSRNTNMAIRFFLPSTQSSILFDKYTCDGCLSSRPLFFLFIFLFFENAIGIFYRFQERLFEERKE